MARWLVEYQGSDNKPKQTSIDLGDKYKTAQEVQNALTAGEIAELYIGGDIVRVQKLER